MSALPSSSDSDAGYLCLHPFCAFDRVENEHVNALSQLDRRLGLSHPPQGQCSKSWRDVATSDDLVMLHSLGERGEAVEMSAGYSLVLVDLGSNSMDAVTIVFGCDAGPNVSADRIKSLHEACLSRNVQVSPPNSPMHADGRELCNEHLRGDVAPADDVDDSNVGGCDNFVCKLTDCSVPE